MDELESNQSSPSFNECNSSFESLRLSGNEPLSSSQEYDNFEAIEELPDKWLLPQKSLTESFKDTFKMCCSGIRTMKTNIAYNIRHSPLDIFTQRQRVILDKNQPVTLLGKTYQMNSKDKERFYYDFSNTIWLTYRKGIYGVESDAGWGCMIRVCQMVLAQTFKRLSPPPPPSQSSSTSPSSSTVNKIIHHFRDTPEAYFSLTRICQKGEINHRWTSSVEIFGLLKSILHSFPELKLQIDMHSSCIEISSMKELQRLSYPLLVFVSNRLGKCKLEQQYKDHLLEVMKVQSFVGAVGGNGGQALYLVGNYAGKVIFMDPHYVQSFEKEQQLTKTSTSTYFQSQPYSIDTSSLAPSVAFNFLVKSKEEFEKLLKQLYEIQTRYQPWVCFEVLSEEIKKCSKAQVHKDDDFQVIA